MSNCTRSPAPTFTRFFALGMNSAAGSPSLRITVYVPGDNPVIS
jgi:hypothetical protein